MSGLGWVGTAEPSDRKSRHAPGRETESLYRDRTENTNQRQKRRRGRTTRRLARIATREARVRQKEVLETAVTYNVRILAVTENNRYGHAERAYCRRLGNLAVTSSACRKQGDRGRQSFVLQCAGSSALGKRKRKAGKDCTDLGWQSRNRYAVSVFIPIS